MNKKGSFTGLGKVFKFTFYQLVKNKSNMISFGLLIVILLFSVPVMSLFMGGGTDVAQTESFYTSVMTMDEFMGADEVGFDSRYIVQYGYSILVMIVCIFSCTYIVRSILEEKTSKLVETLLVSIKSEAMILGKILAIITFVSTMVLAMIASFGISYFVSGMFIDTSFVANTLTNMGLTTESLNIGMELVGVVIVSVILACLMLSLVAALSGAGCSSMEDMESANMSATMIILVCYMATVMASPFGSSPAIFMSLCPLLSTFAAPTYYVTGDIGFGILALSWVIQIAGILLLHRLSGRVYDNLVMYKGKRLKMTKILAMAISGKEGK